MCGAIRKYAINARNGKSSSSVYRDLNNITGALLLMIALVIFLCAFIVRDYASYIEAKFSAITFSPGNIYFAPDNSAIVVDNIVHNESNEQLCADVTISGASDNSGFWRLNVLDKQRNVAHIVHMEDLETTGDSKEGEVSRHQCWSLAKDDVKIKSASISQYDFVKKFSERESKNFYVRYVEDSSKDALVLAQWRIPVS